MSEDQPIEPGSEIWDARTWYFSERVVCAELDHGCTLLPPRPSCPPCLLDRGHSGRHDAFEIDPGNEVILAKFRASKVETGVEK